MSKTATQFCADIIMKKSPIQNSKKPFQPRNHIKQFKQSISQPEGFTLIELLVVISIIGVLSSVVMLAINPARLLRVSRDSRRIADMATIQKALVLYNLELGHWPKYADIDHDWAGWDTSLPAGDPSGFGGTGTFIRDLSTRGFLPSPPRDPVNNVTYMYNYYHYDPGNISMYGCLTPFYVLGIRNFEDPSSVPPLYERERVTCPEKNDCCDTTIAGPSNPCCIRDWRLEYQWLTRKFD